MAALLIKMHQKEYCLSNLNTHTPNILRTNIRRQMDTSTILDTFNILDQVLKLLKVT